MFNSIIVVILIALFLIVGGFLINNVLKKNFKGKVTLKVAFWKILNFEMSIDKDRKDSKHKTPV